MARVCKLFSLALLMGLSGRVVALGLGDITLNSGLNQRLDAQIDIVGALPGDLDEFQAQLAPRELFAQYGLDYPAFLSGLTFRATRDARGDAVLRVRSAQPVTEPFLTFLVEANWPRGRLLREYTVLLDPPAFLPGEANTAVTPAASGEAPDAAVNRGMIEPGPGAAAPAPRERAAPVQPARSAAAPRAGGGSGGGGELLGQEYGPIARGESLWKIAARARPGGATLNQTMLAIYQRNPEAFYGNMNLLRQGATLRIPAAQSILEVSTGRANATLAQDTARWRGEEPAAAAPAGEGAARAAAPGNRPAAAAPAGQLTLVEPEEAGADGGEFAAAQAEIERLRDRNAALAEEVESQRAEYEAELERTRERLALRNQELAELQQRLASLEGGAGAEAATGAGPRGTPGADLNRGEAARDAAASAQQQPGDAADGAVAATAGEESEASGEAAGGAATAGAAGAAQTPSQEQQQARTRPAPTPAQPPPAGGGGPLDFLFGLLGNPLLWASVGLVAVLGAGAVVLRNRSAAREEEGFESFDPFPEEDDALKDTMSTTESTSVEAAGENFATTLDTPFDDDGEPATVVDGGRARAAAPATTQALDMTADMATPGTGAPDRFDLGNDTTQLLDETNDPVSEADFHMAYGLYDQAAELINQALDAEPHRIDLQNKLLEIYFVWGNAEAFRDAAARLQPSLTAAGGGAWDKIVIMGKQICPGDALFAGATGAGAATADLDLGDTAASAGPSAGASGDDDDVIAIGLDELPDDQQMSDELELDLDIPLEGLDDEAAAEPVGTDTTATADTSRLDFSGADDDALDFELELPPPLPEDASDEGEATTLTDPDVLAGAEGAASDAARDDAARARHAEDDGDDGLEPDAELQEIARRLEARMGSTGEGPDLSLDLGQTIAPEAPPQTSVRLDMDDEDDGFGDFQAFTGVSEDDEGGAGTHMPVVPEDEDPLLSSGEFKIELPDDAPLVRASQRGDDAAVTTELTGENVMLGSDFDPLEADGETERALTFELPETERLAVGDATEQGLMIDPALRGEDDEEGASTALISPSGMIGDAQARGDADWAAGEATIESPLMGRPDPSESSLAPTVQAPMATEVSSTAETVSAQVFELRSHFEQQGGSGAGGGDDDTAEVPASQLGLPEVDDGAIDEVGTKLDLARAYIDMGDADGARDILQEVVGEGSSEQRQQAQALLDSI